MNKIDHIILIDSSEKHGRNAFYGELSSCELDEIYKIIKEQNTQNEDVILLKINEDIFKLLDQNLQDNEIKNKILARKYLASLIGSHIGILESDSLTCLLGFKNNDLQQIINSDIDGYDIINLRKTIYIFEYGQTSKLLQQAINDYTQMQGSPITTKIFSTEKQLSSYVSLNGILVEDIHDFSDRTHIYNKQENSKNLIQ